MTGDEADARPHDLDDVRRVASLLASEGIQVWLFGGWAEEVLGLARPWTHGDIDFLYVAPDFVELDRVIERIGWPLEKHLPHKRAVRIDDVITDVFLVRRDESGYYSEFSGQRHSWPDDVVADRSALATASLAGVAEFRAAFARLLELREPA